MHRTSDRSIEIWFLLRLCNWWQKHYLNTVEIHVYFTCLQGKSQAVVVLRVKGGGRSGHLLSLCLSLSTESHFHLQILKFWVKAWNLAQEDQTFCWNYRILRDCCLTEVLLVEAAKHRTQNAVSGKAEKPVCFQECKDADYSLATTRYPRFKTDLKGRDGNSWMRTKTRLKSKQSHIPKQYMPEWTGWWSFVVRQQTSVPWDQQNDGQCGSCVWSSPSGIRR